MGRRFSCSTETKTGACGAVAFQLLPQDERRADACGGQHELKGDLKYKIFGMNPLVFFLFLHLFLTTTYHKSFAYLSSPESNPSEPLLNPSKILPTRIFLTILLTRMFSSVIVVILLALFQIHTCGAQPVNASNFIIKHIASDYFPHAKGDLSAFDVHTRFLGYNDTTQSWLTGLNPASGNSDEEKAKMMTEAAYAKPFDDNDQDMTEDVDSLLAAVAGMSSAAPQKRHDDGSQFLTSYRHAVHWPSCADALSCMSGVTCHFDLDIDSKPRNQCQKVNKHKCCVGWSTYFTERDLFSTTWNKCDELIRTEQLTHASCKGYGSFDLGNRNHGSVCFSDRATRC